MKLRLLALFVAASFAQAAVMATAVASEGKKDRPSLNDQYGPKAQREDQKGPEPNEHDRTGPGSQVKNQPAANPGADNGASRQQPPPPPVPNPDVKVTQPSGGTDSSADSADQSTEDDAPGTPLTHANATLVDPNNAVIGNLRLRGDQGSVLTATVKFKLPNPDLGWTTKDDVKDSTLTVTFTHADGTDYASCDFDLGNLRLNKRRNVGVAQFKLDVRTRGGVVKERQGACDTNLDTEEYEAGIPVMLTGDTILLTLDTQDSDVGSGELK